MDADPGTTARATPLCRQQGLDGAVCLLVNGDVDLANVSSLQVSLKLAAQSEENLIVELSGLNYIDSTGIKALLDAHSIFARTGRRIAFAAPSPRVQKILQILGVAQIVGIFATVEAALNSVRSARGERQVCL